MKPMVTIVKQWFIIKTDDIPAHDISLEPRNTTPRVEIMTDMFVSRLLFVMTPLSQEEQSSRSFVRNLFGPSVKGDNDRCLITPHGPLAAHEGRCVVHR